MGKIQIIAGAVVKMPPESGQPNQSLPVPILIGISGKRIFNKTDANTDRQIADRVGSLLRNLFQQLEDTFPRSPKILLSGAAIGTDLIAADIALQCKPEKNWAVVALLPFKRPLFEEDFRPEDDLDVNQAWQNRYAEHTRTLDRTLTDPRVIVRELPSLRNEPDDVALADRLSRHSKRYDKVMRRNHYEQVGQYIAEAATIMIAVMSSNEQAETSEATGGTARVVAYRRAGMADKHGAAVAQRSAVLRSEWPRAAPPPAGYVWLIDPDELKQADRDAAGFGCKVLPPLLDRLVEEVYAGYPGADLPTERMVSAGPLRVLTNHLLAAAVKVGAHVFENRTEARRMRASLVLAQALERYHRGEAATHLDLTDVPRLTDWLESYRSRISGRQRTVNERVRQDFNWLAGLFVLAVFLFEIFEKVSPSSILLLGLYLVALCLIGVFAWIAWLKQLNEVAEDYRAVAEMLRVQRAWWSAGLTARVDREHLQGADQNLAPIRDGAKTIISWLMLRNGWKDSALMVDWARVRGTSTEPRDFREQKRPPPDWIGGQLWFFVNRVEARERQVNVNNALTWCLFVASGALGLLLLIWLTSPRVITAFTSVAAYPFAIFGGPLSMDPSFVVWIAFAAAVIYFRCLNYDAAQGWKGLLLTFVFGMLAAVFSFLGLVNAEPLIAWASGRSEGAIIAAVQVALVVVSALAGALRYRSERLNVEAEALEYRDALARFERAESLLATDFDKAIGAPGDGENARTLVHELGRAALAENEAWLKSRRERPLTPIVG